MASERLDAIGEGRTGLLANEMQRISLKMSALGGGERPQDPAAPAHTAAAGEGSAGTDGASNSKAVLSALRSLQDKIRVLEEERNSLQICLRQTQEAKEREEQQHRLLQRQLQLQLQESVKALTVRHESEAEAIRSQASQSQGQLSSEVTRLQRRVAEAEAEVERLRERCGQAEHENVSKDEEVRRLRISVADLEAAGDALKKVNKRMEEQVGQDQQARAELLARNTGLEESIKALREAKSESEQRAARAAKEYDRLQTEHSALRRQEANLQQQLRESHETLAHKAEMAASTESEHSTLLSEKRQLEDSLRNVLSINDQLLQKVYDGCTTRSADVSVSGAYEAAAGEMSEMAQRIVEENLNGSRVKRRPSATRVVKDRQRRSKSASVERGGEASRGARSAQAHYAASTAAYRSHLMSAQFPSRKRATNESVYASYAQTALASGEAVASPGARRRGARAAPNSAESSRGRGAGRVEIGGRASVSDFRSRSAVRAWEEGKTGQDGGRGWGAGYRSSLQAFDDEDTASAPARRGLPLEVRAPGDGDTAGAALLFDSGCGGGGGGGFGG